MNLGYDMTSSLSPCTYIAGPTSCVGQSAIQSTTYPAWKKYLPNEGTIQPKLLFQYTFEDDCLNLSGLADFALKIVNE